MNHKQEGNLNQSGDIAPINNKARRDGLEISPDWEKEFEKMWRKGSSKEFHRAFISQLLQERTKEVIEELELLVPQIPPYLNQIQQLKDKYGIK